MNTSITQLSKSSSTHSVAYFFLTDPAFTVFNCGSICLPFNMHKHSVYACSAFRREVVIMEQWWEWEDNSIGLRWSRCSGGDTHKILTLLGLIHLHRSTQTSANDLSWNSSELINIAGVSPDLHQFILPSAAKLHHGIKRKLHAAAGLPHRKLIGTGLLVFLVRTLLSSSFNFCGSLATQFYQGHQDVITLVTTL